MMRVKERKGKNKRQGKRDTEGREKNDGSRESKEIKIRNKDKTNTRNSYLNYEFLY